MFLSEKTPLVAVDIGSYSIKLAQLAQTRGTYELLGFGAMPLEEGCVVDGVVRRQHEVIEGLTNLIKAEKVETKFTVSSVAGEAVIIKRIKVPSMSEEELAESIGEEAEQYIPFDIDDVSIDFQILDTSPVKTEEDEEDEDKMEILLVAVQREIIDNRMDLLLEAGLKPAIIDLDVFAMVNAASLGADLTKMGAVALIDLGESFTHLNIMLDGVTAYTRDIPVGGHTCTRKLMSKFEINFKQAIDFKSGHIPNRIQKDGVAEVIIGSFDKILDEIQKSFEFFSTTSNTQVERIMICGGGALIRGVDAFLSGHLKIPVQVLDPLQGLKIQKSNIDRETLQRMAPISTVAIGLATRRFDYQ